MFSDKAIQLQPIFAQWIQNIHLLAPAFPLIDCAWPGSGALMAFVFAPFISWNLA
jgi:photosystem I P700 chlorophyll a apoprotein A1